MQERRYSYKPTPRFFGDGKVFFGIELEVEAPDATAKTKGLEDAGNPRWAYAKHDGSLGMHGWEMVTHPISMNFFLSRSDVRDYRDIAVGTVLTARYKDQTYTAKQLAGGRVEWNGEVYTSISACGLAIARTHNPERRSVNGYQFFGLTGDTNAVNPTTAFFRLVKQLSDLGYKSHDSGRCGFHVHVSREGFAEDGTLDNAKFFRFKSLVNGALFRKLSQRETFNFCQQEPVTRDNYLHRAGRYTAVNVTEKTVEVRIFRGNLREARLRKNIEAVIAALEFAGTTTEFTAPTDEQFATFVRENEDRFPNLAAYIAEHTGSLDV